MSSEDPESKQLKFDLILSLTAYLHCRVRTLIPIQLGTDICPKNGYINDQRSGSGSESESKSVQGERFLYSTMYRSGLVAIEPFGENSVDNKYF